MNFDKDLQSVQEARDLVNKANDAHLEFKHYSQDQVDKIVKAMADAGYEASEKLAKIAHEETGFGKWEDKKIKNAFGTKNVYESIKNLRTVGVIEVQENGKLVKIAEPMGVVAALIPSTNPTSTAMFKAIISVKCRNSMVASPHPRAVKCIRESLSILSQAAEKAGAPAGLLQCMETPSIEGTNELMRHKKTGVILATGSTPMVKAAYSTGTPAFGVGSGNVPAFIERTANYKKAVADIIYGTTFDNGTLCSSEQSMIVDRPLREKAIEEAKRLGAYFVSGNEKMKVESVMVKGGKINPDIVGQNAVKIAQMAGLSVPENTSVLVAEIDKVGKEEPFSIEKLSPTLAFYTVDGWLEGCHKCIELLEFGGIGHTMAIHSNDKEIIMKFALEKPAFRIVVNTPASVGAVGYTTALNPSMTLGPGTWGGSIISENVSAQHLLNIKTLAFETNPVNKGDSLSDLGKADARSEKEISEYMKQVENRLTARAGNPAYKPAQQGSTYSQKSNVKKGEVLGSGISEDEIQKIIEEFNK